MLYALEQPHRADRVRLAALTPLLGRTVSDVDERGDELVAEIGGLLRELSAVYIRSGFSAVFERHRERTARSRRDCSSSRRANAG